MVSETFHKIGNIEIIADVDATLQLYQAQNHIIDDCICSDCEFYFNTFVNMEFELFNFLSSVGVDLRKNLSSEPTGVWCFVDESEVLQFFEHAYQINGHINKSFGDSVQFLKIELGYKVIAHFVQSDLTTITVYVDANRE